MLQVRTRPPSSLSFSRVLHTAWCRYVDREGGVDASYHPLANDTTDMFRDFDDDANDEYEYKWGMVNLMHLWRHNTLMQHFNNTTAFWGDKILRWTSMSAPSPCGLTADLPSQTMRTRPSGSLLAHADVLHDAPVIARALVCNLRAAGRKHCIRQKKCFLR